jgi:hypothetical protein
MGDETLKKVNQVPGKPGNRKRKTRKAKTKAKAGFFLIPD